MIVRINQVLALRFRCYPRDCSTRFGLEPHADLAIGNPFQFALTRLFRLAFAPD